jgi:predicted NBD/HSP70 family sugar kinase
MSSTALVRDVNRSAVLRLIGVSGPISRAAIARELGLSPATVTAVTRQLIAMGFVRVVEQAPPHGGRPPLLLGIVGSAAHALGVKLAPDHVVGVRVDLDGEVLDGFESKFDPTSPDALARLATLLRSHAVQHRDIPFLGIGLGLPGIVDADGTVASPMLGWGGVSLAEQLERDLSVPVLVDNDVNTLVIAERLYGRGFDHFVTVTIGRGVGLGIIINGDVYRGARGGAGEFGHVTVVAGGPPCECGKQGCLEAVVSDPALVARARAAKVIGPRQGIERLRALADAGDARAAAVFGGAGEVLGRAVADLVNILAPEIVLMSGEGTQAWPHMAEPFLRELSRDVFSPLRDVPVEVDPWDDATWARGAATLVLQQAFVPALDEGQRELSVRARIRQTAAAAVAAS